MDMIGVSKSWDRHSDLRKVNQTECVHQSWMSGHDKMILAVAEVATWMCEGVCADRERAGLL